MITRRSASLAAGIGLLFVHPLSRGQATGTIRRVGIMLLSSEAGGAHLRAAFTQGMQDLGWVEGNNIEYRFAYAAGDVGRLDGLASELIRQRVDVILAGNPPSTRVAQRATKTIPIVMAYGSNAVESGFVASLARPGGNTTGISDQIEEMLGKLIEVLHEVTPGARRIAAMLNESHPAHPAYWAAAQRACTYLGLDAVRVVASSPAQLGAAVEQVVQQRSHAVVVVSDPMYFAERAKLQELMQTTRLPVAYGFREHVVLGGLLSYASSLAANFRYAAKFVDKILKGAKPADLPVEQPMRFELVINQKTAKALGLTIPYAVLLRADELIE